jgi:hypothetical protein
MNLDYIWYARDAILCLVSILGAIAALLFALRRKRLAGWLAVAAFLLVAVEPVCDLIIWRILALNPDVNYASLNWSYACIATPALVVALALLLASIFLSARPPSPGDPPQA